MGSNIPHPWHLRNGAAVAEFETMWLRGDTLAVMAAHFGCGKTTVSMRAKTMGLRPRTQYETSSRNYGYEILDPRPRRCLCCGREFTAPSPFVRRCKLCHEAEGADSPFNEMYAVML